jgi:hypothetical protein
MPRPSRRHIPDDQLDHLRQAHQAQLDALAERSVLAERLAAIEARRAATIAALDVELAAARADLLAADGRLAELIGVEAAANVVGTPVPELRRAARGLAS